MMSYDVKSRCDKFIYTQLELFLDKNTLQA
jgi:hypothetical protein